MKVLPVRTTLSLPARAGLSPALVIMGALAALVLACSVGLDLVLLPHDGGLGRDFSAFYAAGLALRHGLDPYNWSQIGVIEAHMRSIGDPRQPYAFNAYANPPLFASVMAACTTLTDRQAYVAWIVVTGVAMLAGAVLLMRSYGVRGYGWMTLLFLVTPVPVICLFLGQQTPLLLCALGSALAALRAQRPLLAGTIMTVGWIKPHLLFPLMLVIVAMLGWRVARRLIAGFAGVSLLLGLLSWLTTGGALFASWGRTLALFGRTVDTFQPLLSSLAGLYFSVAGRPWSSYLALGCLALWCFVAALVARRARQAGLTPDDDEWLRLFSLALVAWLLLTPMVHPADLVLIVPALLVVLGRRLERLADPLVRLALCALLTAPEADLLGFRPNYVLTYSVLVPLTLLVALRPWRALSTRGLAQSRD